MNRKGWTRMAATVLLVGGLAAGQAFAADTAAPDRPGAGLGLGLGRAGGGMVSVVAGLLGMETDQVAAQRQSGKSLLDISAEAGVAAEIVVKTVTAARQEALDGLVEAGKVTREQADLCLANMEERVQANLSRTTTGRPWGAAGNAGAQRNNGGRGMGQGFGMRLHAAR